MLCVRHLDERGDGMRSGEFHRIRDVSDSRLQRPQKYSRKGKGVIDLIWIVGSSGGDDAGACRMRVLGADLRLGICERKYDRIRRHSLHMLGSEHSCHTHPDKYIRTLDRCSEISEEIAGICFFGDFLFIRIQIRAMISHDAATVAGDDIAHSEIQQ